jgi:hypothetical protein
MDLETAQAVVVGIALIAAVVWLGSLLFLLRSAALVRSAEGGGPLLMGSAEVDGEAPALADKAAGLLARGVLGPLKIVSKTADQIVFERLDPGMANQPPGRWFRHGELRFTTTGTRRTRIDWAAAPARLQGMLWAAGLIQLIALATLVAGGWAMFTWVASSPDPILRWQSFQMLQIVHLLWPPYLLAGLYRKGMRAIAAEFAALASNLPFVGEVQ